MLYNPVFAAILQ